MSTTKKRRPRCGCAAMGLRPGTHAQTCSVGRKQYPEHEKLHALGGRNQVVADFLEWLEDGGRIIAEAHLHTEACDPPRENRADDFPGRECGLFGNGIHSLYPWQPTGKGDRIARILSLYFGIDAAKLEAEKRAMLEEIRKANQR